MYFLKFRHLYFLWLFFTASGQLPAALKDKLYYEKNYSENCLFPSIDEKTGKNNSINNLIKLSPSALLRQRVILFYDRKVWDKLFVSFSLGYIFGRDNFELSYVELFKSYTDYAETLNPGTLIKGAKFLYALPSTSVGFKYFFNDWSANRNTFFQIDYRFEGVNYTLNKSILDRNNISEEQKNFNFIFHHASVGIGHLSFFGKRKNLFNEIGLSVGYKWLKYDEYKMSHDPTMSLTAYHKTHKKLATSVFPTIHIRYSIGLGF